MKQRTEGMRRLADALQKAITGDDFDEIARQLLAKAKAGNASAAKLVLETLATPAPLVPPTNNAGDELPDLDPFRL